MPHTDSEFLHLQAAVAGRFSLEREIGRGGMGIVYLAHDVILERPVAIKLLAPPLAEQSGMRRRFLREARTAAQCFHPHIVPIHAVEESGRLAFLVMSYVRGETLADRLRQGPLDGEAVRRLGREIGWALDYAHGRGVVHRDVKPENILLEANTGRALITDFGIALRDDPTATPRTGEVAGTALYMAPEQALGGTIDGRADLYALGVTLWAAAAGRLPFTADSAAALLVQHATTPAPSIAGAVPLLAPELADAVDRCLSKAPDDRFPTAAAFVGAIAPPPAPPPLPPALVPVNDASGSARSALSWAAVIGAVGALFAIGEGDALGQAIVEGIATGASVGFAGFGLFRASEALLAARRAISSGVGGQAIAEQFVGARPATSLTASERLGALAWVGAGGVLAWMKARLPISTMLKGLPFEDVLSSGLEIGLYLAAPYMVGHHLSRALRGTRVAHWMYRRVSQPLSRLAARLVGAGELPGPGDFTAEPTELRLDHAAQAILARLPATVQQDLGALPGAVAGLAQQADALRRANAGLAQEERQARARGADTAELQRIRERRERTQHRLGEAIAALETVRLDLLRLETGTMTVAGLTEHLDAVRDIGRQVDAVAEVEQLLREPTPV